MNSERDNEMTANDLAVLNAIFNPWEPNLPAVDLNQDPNDTNGTNDTPVDNVPVSAKQLEVQAIKLTENGQFEQALQIFNDLIKEHPDCASFLNNRAQAHQLSKKLDLALDDLNLAIDLSEKCGNKRVLGQSLSQRAIIHRLNGNQQQSDRDFEQAAHLGNTFARRQLVQLNPYAALCNQMLNKMMNNIRQGKPEDA